MPVFWERMQWQPIPKQIYKLNSSKFKIYVFSKIVPERKISDAFK